jgi:hypothetical protein
MGLNIWIIGGNTDIDDDIYNIIGLVTNINVPDKIVTSVSNVPINLKDSYGEGYMKNSPLEVFSTVVDT